MAVQPRIIVHGGAGDWQGFDENEAVQGVYEAAAAGLAVLSKGGTALDAVETAARILEDFPLYDAGIGSFLNEQGEVEMDALITDGREITFGAVAAVQHIRYPITLARLVMERTQHCFFVGDGAERLAVSLGLELVPNLTFVTAGEFEQYKKRLETHAVEGAGLGTVGAVALDSAGRIASATSTGGTPHKKKGRVGDSPIFGAGGYADNRFGGASATGRGEIIMRFLLSRTAIDHIAAGLTAYHAAEAAVEAVKSRVALPEIGVITVDAHGRLGAAHTTAAMPVAWGDAGGSIRAAMRAPYGFE